MAGRDLLLVKYLDTPRSVSDLAHISDRDPTRISRLVHYLAELGLVTLEKEGRSLIVRRSGTTSALLAQLLDTYPHHPWARLLTDANLEIVSFFSSPMDNSIPRASGPPTATRRTPFVPKTAADAVAWTGYSSTHVHRILSGLRRHTIILRRGSYHYLAPEHETLREFADQYHRSLALRELQSRHPKARLLWQLGRVALYDTPEPIGEAQLGGTSLASKYGIPLIQARSTHLIAPWRPTSSDAIFQTFLEAPTRTSNLTYACLLWAKNRPADFERRARQYGIPLLASEIKAYVREPERGKPPFPSSHEYQDLAAQYGVA